MLRKKLNNVKAVAKENIMPVMSGMAVMAMMVMSNGAFAASGAEELVTWVIRVIGALIVVLGLFYAITGLVSYASAHAEGDGPAQNKATGRMSAGAMLVILSIILIASSGTLAGYISTAI